MITKEQKNELRQRLAEFLLEEEPLAMKTAFKVGGSAAFYLQPESLAELGLALKTLAELELKFLLLGAGCNILVAAKGVRDRVVISLGQGFGHFEIMGSDSWSVMLRAESGVRLSRLIRLSAVEGYSGLEKLAAIISKKLKTF